MKKTKGAIAQLGERLHGMQEVGGSSPPSSTKINEICYNNNCTWTSNISYTCISCIIEINSYSYKNNIIN